MNEQSTHMMDTASSHESAQAVGWARAKHDWLTLGLSLLLHTILLMLVFVFSRSVGGSVDGDQPDRQAGIVLTVRDAKTERTDYLDSSDIQPLQDQAVAEHSASPPPDAPPVIIEESQLDKLELPGFEFSSTSDASTIANQVTPPSESKPYQLSDADKKLIAADQAYFESLKPAGPATSISVFGSGQLQGRSFVFLLDRSKSMGTGGLGVLELAGKELSLAIDRLEPHHTFQILGYNSRTAPMKARRLLPATDEHRAAVAPFIHDMVAFGKTKHEFAIIAAIGYRPDVIVLLSDGDDFGSMTQIKLDKIHKATRGATQIHCVQFGLGPAKSATGFMEKLANQNNGSFRYVDVNEQRR